MIDGYSVHPRGISSCAGRRVGCEIQNSKIWAVKISSASVAVVNCEINACLINHFFYLFLGSFCCNEMFLCEKLHFLLNKSMTFALYMLNCTVSLYSRSVQLIQSGFRSMCSEHQLPIPLLTTNHICVSHWGWWVEWSVCTLLDNYATTNRVEIC